MPRHGSRGWFLLFPLQEVTKSISNVRSPISQLLSASTRAEKSLKSGMDKAKKAAAKKQQDSAKAAKAAEKAGTAALFDQGAAVVQGIKIFKVDELTKKTDQDPVELDLTSPFIVQAPKWVSEALKEGSPMRLQIDSFTASFDTMRAKTKLQ